MKTRTMAVTSLSVFALIAFFLGPVSGQQNERSRRRPPEKIFDKLDKNRDGFLTPDETPPNLWARLSRFDENHDGKLSKQELAKHDENVRGEAGAKRVFKRLDRNNDGFLTADEVTGKLWERLLKLDRNGDGKISQEEASNRPGEGRRSSKRGARSAKP